MLLDNIYFLRAGIVSALLLLGFEAGALGQESSIRIEGVPEKLSDVPQDAKLEDIERYIERLDSYNSVFRSAMSRYANQVHGAQGEAYVRYAKLAEEQGQTNLPLYTRAKGMAVQYLVRQSMTVEDAARVIEAYADSLTNRDVGEIEAKLAALTVHHFPEGDSKLKWTAVSKLADALRRSDSKDAQRAAEYIHGMVTRESLVGTDFELIGETTDGKNFNIADVAGKVVLIDYWATWCGPCIDEQKNIRNMFDEYQAAGFVVVGVNGDTDKQDVLNYLSSDDCPVVWPTLYSGKGIEDPAFKRLGIMEIPFSVLIDRNGVVVDTQVDGEGLAQAIERVMSRPTPGDEPKSR